MAGQAADVIIIARTVHTMAGDAPPVTALAVRDGKIAATAGPDDRGELAAAWRGPGTVIIDEPGLFVLPVSPCACGAAGRSACTPWATAPTRCCSPQ